MNDLRILLLTDGKKGDIVPMRGVAKKLRGQNTIIEEHVIEKSLLNFLPPQFCLTQKQDEKIFNQPLPHIVLASSWRTLSYVKKFKKLRVRGNGNGKYPLLIFFKNPRQMYNVPDLIWLPEHDRRSGKNIFSTLASPHPFCEQEIAKAKKRGKIRFGPWCNGEGKPPIGIILGGNSKHVKWNRAECFSFASCLANLPNSENIIVVPSRRTPSCLISAVKSLANGRKFYIWQGEGENPYVEVLAFCSRLIVTGDSHNMVSECVGMGKSVYVWRPVGLAKKLNYFLSKLAERNLISIIDNKNYCDLTWQNEMALDCTKAIAKKVQSLL